MQIDMTTCVERSSAVQKPLAKPAGTCVYPTPWLIQLTDERELLEHVGIPVHQLVAGEAEDCLHGVTQHAGR
ncbi:hypothetical protein FQZ97_766110 [compost metagenome]